MKLFIALGGVASLLLFGCLWYVLRQLRCLCQQLRFLQTHDSNMLLRTDTRLGYLGELTDCFNELVQKYRAEYQIYLKKEQILSDTYTNLSHDIRTPLTSLDGYIQLLSECSSPEDQDYYLSIIQERISSLRDMLEELFTFTRLKNGSFEMALTECDLNKILKTTLFAYYDEWQKRDIIPSFSLPETPIPILGNEAALRRLIQNIIKNGLDHGKKRLTLSLTQQNSCGTSDAHVLLYFENEVAPTDDIDISQVFERFYKADTARSQSSSGLGLAIAKELVLRMNGTIRADTKTITAEDGSFRRLFCIEIRFPADL